MQQVWAPWRMEYVAAPREPGCVFCAAAAYPEAARERLVLHHAPHALALLNRFPYNNGHLLVVPRRHVAAPGELSAEEFVALNDLLRDALGVLRQAYGPHGFNVGMNLGTCAGAGIPGHMHWHIVPRWEGDTNFLPVLADVRSIPEHLSRTWDRLAPLFGEISGRTSASGERG